jgi:hypothetical protein
MRKTKRKPLDTAVAAAWEKVFAESAVDDLPALQAQGWMTVGEFADKTKFSHAGAASALKRLAAVRRVDMKKIRCMIADRAKTVNIYRPRI